MKIPCSRDAARDCFFLPMPLKLHGDVGISVNVNAVLHNSVGRFFLWYQKKVVSLQTISNHDFIEN